MLLIDTRTARALITILLFALALGFLYVARQTLIAFLFAIFFAYLMSPMVNYLEKLLKGRGRAIAVHHARQPGGARRERRHGHVGHGHLEHPGPAGSDLGDRRGPDCARFGRRLRPRLR